MKFKKCEKNAWKVGAKRQNRIKNDENMQNSVKYFEKKKGIFFCLLYPTFGYERTKLKRTGKNEKKKQTFWWLPSILRGV